MGDGLALRTDGNSSDLVMVIRVSIVIRLIYCLTQIGELVFVYNGSVNDGKMKTAATLMMTIFIDSGMKY